jgi:hypothetical protein
MPGWHEWRDFLTEIRVAGRLGQGVVMFTDRYSSELVNNFLGVRRIGDFSTSLRDQKDLYLLSLLRESFERASVLYC